MTDRRCACGRRKGPYARGCIRCYLASVSARAKARYECTCQWCGATFWRKPRLGTHNPDRDKRLFCTKRCARADRQQLFDALTVARRADFAAAREEVIEERRARPCDWCGEPLGDLGLNPQRQFHPACRVSHVYAKVVHARNPQPSVHVCPCCGVSFVTRFRDVRRVWCSPRCCKRMRKLLLAHGIALNRIPLEERNVLAALMANVKRSTRLINVWKGGRNATDPQIAEIPSGLRAWRGRKRPDPPALIRRGVGLG